MPAARTLRGAGDVGLALVAGDVHAQARLFVHAQHGVGRMRDGASGGGGGRGRAETGAA